MITMTSKWNTILTLLTTLICLEAQPSWGSTLSDAANGMSAGSWVKLETNGFSPNYLKYPGGNGNSSLQFMGTGMWDSTSNKVLFLSAGHFNFSQLHVYTESTNSWTIGKALPKSPRGLGHGYNHNAMDVKARVLGFLNIHNSRADLYEYSLSGNSWTQKSSFSNDGDTAHGYVYFPERNRWYLADGTFGNIREYNRKTDSWSKFKSDRECFGGGSKLKTGYYHQFASYNPVRSEIVFGGGNTQTGGSNTSRALCKMDTDGNISQLPNAPTDLRVPGSGNTGSQIAIDPSSGDLLVLDQAGKFYAFNFSSEQWKTINDQSTMPATFKRSVDSVSLTFVVPISTYGVLMFGKEEGNNSSIWLYKHKQGNTTSTPTPKIDTSDAPVDSVPPSAPSQLALVNSPGSPSPPPPPPPPSGTSFADLCRHSNTIFCQDFDELPIDNADKIEGIFSNGGKCSGLVNKPLESCPEIDGGTLKFTIPSNSGSGGSGQYYVRFADHNGGQSIGPGQEVFVQWKQRFSASFLNTKFERGGGWKHGMLGAADEYSCASNEVVLQNTFQRGFPQMYHACGKFEAFDKKVSSYDFDLQPGGPGGACSYTDARAGKISAACTKYYPDEWLTYQIGITHGAVGEKSRIRLWASREGQPSTLVIDFQRVLRNNKGFGKMWLLPYHTAKSNEQAHPIGYTWYDQLIISRTQLPDR